MAQDLLIICTAENLVAIAQVSTDIMMQLLDEYSEAQCLKIMFIVDQYNSLNKFANSVGNQWEPGYKNRTLTQCK